MFEKILKGINDCSKFKFKNLEAIEPQNGDNALLYVFGNKNMLNIQISKSNIEYLIEHSQLTQENKQGNTPLHLAFTNNVSQSLYLKGRHWEHLIINSNLNHENNYGKNPLYYLILNNYIEKIQPGKDLFEYILDNTNKKIKISQDWQALDSFFKKESEHKLGKDSIFKLFNKIDIDIPLNKITQAPNLAKRLETLNIEYVLEHSLNSSNQHKKKMQL